MRFVKSNLPRVGWHDILLAVSEQARDKQLEPFPGQVRIDLLKYY